jgi:hypothetical protein
MDSVMCMNRRFAVPARRESPQKAGQFTMGVDHIGAGHEITDVPIDRDRGSRDHYHGIGGSTWHRHGHLVPHLAQSGGK